LIGSPLLASTSNTSFHEDVIEVLGANSSWVTISRGLSDVIVMAEGSLLGDVNGDSSVNALDLTEVERIIAGLDAVTPNADVNEDGAINALDVTQIERIIVGLV